MKSLLPTGSRLPWLRAMAVGFLALTATTVASAASLGNLETSILGFTQSTHPLTIEFSEGGTGTVQANPPGGQCTSTCTLPYSPGRTVAVTATADAGSTFFEWVGCDETSGTGGAICSVTMSGNRTITATFTKP